MDKLVKFLIDGKHSVVIEPRITDYGELEQRLIELGFIFVKFTDTVGGTELGLNLIKNKTNIENADFTNGRGTIDISGTCELNYHHIRCNAIINLETKSGKASVELIDNES